jgi:hypothetical protein
MNDKIPLINRELLEYLNKLFPEQSADLQDSERTIFYKSGQRSVVKHLLEKSKYQLEEK